MLVERRANLGGTVCGGFLGWDALAGLEALGLDVGSLGAMPIRRLRLIAGGRSVETPLPGRAAGLSRGRLDAAMLTLAEGAGAEILRGRAVRRTEGLTALLDDGDSIAAERLIIATGKHALRGCPRDAGTGSVGLRTTIPAPPGLAGKIELHLFRGGYAGLLVQEDGLANLCLSVSPGRLREAGGRPEALIEALSREAPAITRAGTQAERWDTIANVPYGWRAGTAAPGLYRIGDQAAVIASLAGDGIAVALASGRSAAEAILSGKDGPAWQPRFARRAAGPLACAEAMRGIAESPPAARVAIGLLARLPWAAGLAARLTRIGH